MKRTLQRIISALLIVAVAFSFAGCSSDEAAIKGVLNNFESACNNQDAEAILACLSPAISETIQVALDIAGLFSNKTPDQLMEKVASLVLGNSLLGTSDFFTTMNIKVDSVNVTDEDSANGTATVTYTVSGTEHTKVATFKCVKSEDQWYISAFNIAL